MDSKSEHRNRANRIVRTLACLATLGLLAASCGSDATTAGTALDDTSTSSTTTSSGDDSTESLDDDEGETDEGETDEGETDEGDTDDGDTDDGDTDEGDTDDGETDEADHEDDTTDSDASAGTVDLSLFADGALVGEPPIDDCTLSDGSAAECYTITVIGTPVNHDVGPFCPTSVNDGEDAGGLWFDGEESYAIDGEFFTELAEIYGDELWNNLVNEDGSIEVIDNAEDFAGAARAGIAEEYYYNCVEGKIEWLDGGEQPTATIQFPVTPVPTDSVTVEFPTGQHETLGFTFSGSLMYGSADIDAILSSYTIAAFDACGGHINGGGYHIHGTTGCSDVGEAPEGETAPFALALDGHTVHAPAEGLELDECNGHTTEEYGYHYHANSVEQNATLTCVTGLTAEGAGERDRGGDRPAREEDE